MPTLRDLAQRIREEADPLDIIGAYVQLTRRGSRYVGLCPFHDDHRPSMSVDADRGLYHCFVCKAGGDTIRFVQQIEGVDFPGALELLANRLGIPFDMYRGVPREVAEGAKRREDTLREACQLGRDFFRQTLKGPKGQGVRAYIERRGISPQIIERFELGYAPHEWEAMVGVLRGKGFRPQTAVEAGLAIYNEERGSFYDRFRGRLIFPIWDVLGRPVAFGGRILDETEQDSPKYINSPETPIYKKGSTLYAFHLAKEAIKERRRVVLCEGYMDVIAAHGAGLTEAVASLGTALTETQAKQIKRHAARVVFLYDADTAGQEATRRGCEVLRKQGLQVDIAPLERGLDPDDLVRRDGAEALRELVDSAQPALRLLTGQLLESPDAPGDAVQRRIWILDQVAPALRANPNEISRDDEVGQLAEWIGLDEELVRRHLAQTGPRAAQELRKEIEHRKLDRPPVAEQSLVRCLLERPELAPQVEQRQDLDELITDSRIRSWVERFLDGTGRPPDGERHAIRLAEWLAAGDEAGEVLLREILMVEEDFSDPEPILAYTLKRLEREAAQRRLTRLCQVFGDATDAQIAESAARDVHRLGRQIFPESPSPLRPPRR